MRIVITGAGGGLGRELVQHLLAQKQRVVAVEADADKLEALAQELGQPEQLEIAAADLCDPAGVEGFFAQLGPVPIDGLAHLVGGYFGGFGIDQTPVAAWQQMVEVNLHSTFLVLRSAATRMLSQKQPGSIVCMGSVMARSGAAGHSAYAAAKAGVLALVKSAAMDLADSLIRVNAVLPTTMATPANIRSMPDADRSQWVTPQEVSELIWYLLSNRSAKVTGACIEIAGKSYTAD